MTRYLPLLFCLSACQTAGDAGLVGPPGPQGPQGEQGPKGDPAPAAKQLHLINTDNGDDLGLYVTTGAAWNESAGGVVFYALKAALVYPDPDCKGAPQMTTTGSTMRQSSLFPGPSGTLIRPLARVGTKVRYRSGTEWVGGASRCANIEAETYAVPFMDTAIKMAPIDADALDIELR